MPRKLRPTVFGLHPDLFTQVQRTVGNPGASDRSDTPGNPGTVLEADSTSFAWWALGSMSFGPSGTSGGCQFYIRFRA